MAWDFLNKLRARNTRQPGTLRDTTPDVHLTPHAPEAMRGVDVNGGELDGVNEHPGRVDPATRSWRAGSRLTVDVSGDVALSDDRDTAAGAHTSRGKPDARRTQQAPSGAPTAPAGGVFDESRTNTRGAVALSPNAAPERPRQGFTGADPARVATMQVAHTIRPFDKGIADHPGTIDKASQANPTASRPPQRGRLAGARPSAGGTGAGTGMLPIGLHPGTTRQQPGPWAAGITETDPGAPSGARARGWRL